MEIREYRNYNEEEILGLYTAVGWTAYTEDPAALRRGYENSLLVLGAYEIEPLHVRRPRMPWYKRLSDRRYNNRTPSQRK